MKTRIYFVIFSEEKNESVILQHFYGDTPQHVKSSLQNFLMHQLDWDVTFITNSLLKGDVYFYDEFYPEPRKDKSFELTTKWNVSRLRAMSVANGFKEYIFTVDCDNKKINCYNLNVSDTFKTCIEKGEPVEIF